MDKRDREFVRYWRKVTEKYLDMDALPDEFKIGASCMARDLTKKKRDAL